MKISPRHLAAAHYTIIAVFVVASWRLLLTPLDQAIAQLESMLAPGADNRIFFIWLIAANLLTVATAIAFWFRRASSYPFSVVLVCISVALLTWALLWSDVAFMVIYAIGCSLSVWSWWQPNLSLKSGRARGSAPLS